MFESLEELDTDAAARRRRLAAGIGIASLVVFIGVNLWDALLPVPEEDINLWDPWPAPLLRSLACASLVGLLCAVGLFLFSVMKQRRFRK